MPNGQFWPSTDVLNQWATTGTPRYGEMDDASDLTYIHEVGVPGGGDDEELQFFGFDVAADTLKSGTRPGASDTINSVTIYYRSKRTGTISNFYIIIDDGASDRSTSADKGSALTTSYADYNELFSNAPGGGAWSYAELQSLDFGFRRGLDGFKDDVFVAEVYIDVDFTAAGGMSAPTVLKLDGSTNPTTGVSEHPNFTAQHNGAGTTINRAYIEIYEDAGMVTQVADSGWLDIADVADGADCEVISWNVDWLQADYLKSNHTYYWRINFKDALAVATLPLLLNFYDTTVDGESGFSALATFGSTPLIRQWHLGNYNQRKILKFTDDHAAADSGLVIPFDIQTGLRESITDKGCFNEATQASGGFEIESYNNKTHLVFLSKPVENNFYSVYIVSRDDPTGEWGEAVFIMTAHGSDTHYFPVFCIDGDGYLHVFRSGHSDVPLQYMRSRLPNNSGSLPTDNFDEINWIKPSSLPTLEAITTDVGPATTTYPIAFYVAGKDRIYVFCRGSSENEYSQTWSADNGVTWSTVRLIISDQHGEKLRVYLYGLRYDNIDERLHISYTFNHNFDDGDTVTNNEVSLGIWYAYSDLDDTWPGSYSTEGFNVWREADGSVIGLTGTDPIGNNNSTGPGWADTINQAIVYGPNEESSVFTETLVLDRFRKPVVFFEQKLRAGLPTTPFHPAVEWTDLVCASYSSDIGVNGTWSINYISEQVNENLRVRRSSAAVQTDIDGIIHCWYPVGSTTYWRSLPTADVDDTGITPSTGVDNYTLLDDGFTFCNPAEYVTMAVSTSEMSFTHNGIIESDKTILGIEIECCAKKNSAISTMNGYVKISSIDYNNATSQTTDNTEWYWYKYTWSENPATAAAWTTSEINNLEFGLKNISTGTIDVCRCLIKVLYTESSNAEYVSNEILYTTSYDDGLTWNRVSKSLNSGEGLPMMNHAHRLTVDEVSKICWSSGFNIFYLDNESGVFSDMRTDGKDIRLYYGNSEIDRVFNYVDKNPSKIYFKLQASILIDAEWTTKDYIIYYDYPDESTNAQSDPHNIYKYFNGFEQYEDGDLITGDGWTFNSGSGEVYGSPPNHNNKVHGGNKSFRIELGGDTEKSILTAEVNTLVEFGMWVESSNPSGVLIEDGSGNRVGVGYTGGYAGVYDGSSWLDADRTGLPGLKRQLNNQMHEYSFYLNSNGITAWGEKDEIVRELNVTPTTVDKVVMFATSDTYFDFIKVSNSYEAVSDTDVIFDNWSYSIIAVDSDNSSDNGSTDGKHYNFQATAIKVSVTIVCSDIPTVTGTAYFRLWWNEGTTYDKSMVRGFEDFTVTVNASGNNTGTTSTIFIDASKIHSLKLDWYLIDYTMGGGESATFSSTLSKVTITSVSVFNPTLEIYGSEIKGVKFLTKLVGRGKTRFYYKYDISETYIGYVTEFPVENVGFIDDAIIDFDVDYTAEVTAVSDMPIESIGALTNLTDFIIEVLVSPDLHDEFPIDYTALKSNVSEFKIEYGKARSLSTAFPVSYIGFHSTDTDLNIDFIGTVLDEKDLPIEYVRSRLVQTHFPIEHTTPLHHTTSLPISYIGPLTAAINVFPVEIQKLVENVADYPIEFQLASESIVTAMPVEITKFVHPIIELPVSYTGVIGEISVNVFPIDFTINFSNVNELPIDYTASRSMARYLNVSYLSGKEFESTLNVDWTKLLSTAYSFPVSYVVQSENIITSIPVAYTKGFELIRTLPVTYKAGIQSVTTFPVEYITGFDFTKTTEFPIDFTAGIDSIRHTPIEINSALNIINTSEFPIDFRGAPTFDVSFNIDITKQRTVAAEFIIENTTFLSLETDLNIDYLVNFMITNHIPVSYLGALILAIIIDNIDLKKPGMTAADIKIMSAVTDLLRPGITGMNLLIPSANTTLAKTKIITPDIKGGRGNKQR